MSLYRPKNSPYIHYDFVIKGARFHGSTGTKNTRAAEAIEAKLRTEAAENGTLRKRQAMTIDVAANTYYEQVAKFQPSRATTEYQLKNLVTGIEHKDTLLSDIDGKKLAAYVARRRSKVADSSVNREIEVLRQVMRRADRIWKVDVGEMPNWSELMLPEPTERIRELTAAEERRLFGSLRPDLHGMVRFALWTGMRLSNVIGLTWEQIDWDEGVIKLKVKSKRPGGDSLTVPLTPLVIALLQTERGRNPAFVFTYKCARSRQARRKGCRYPFTKTGWRRVWKAALAESLITDFRFHDTRHTAATRTLRAEGSNLKVVQKMLGHRNIATTARYAHAMVEDVRAAMVGAQSRNSPEVVDGGNAKAVKAKTK